MLRYRHEPSLGQVSEWFCPECEQDESHGKQWNWLRIIISPVILVTEDSCREHSWVPRRFVAKS